jgi:hypothetical protein
MKQIDIRADTMKLAMDQLRSIGSQLYSKQHSGVYTSASVANQISTGDWGNSHASGAGQFRDQTAQTTNKRSTVVCTGSLYLNGNFAGLYDYAYISGNTTLDAVDQQDAYDHWFTGNQDTHWALVCVDGNLTQGNRAIIKPPVRKLGFVLNVDGAYVLNGMTSMTNRGANHSGTGDSHGYTAPVAIPVNGSITIPATGGAGGARISTTYIGHTSGNNGGTATNGSGGGGSGCVSVHGSVSQGISGAGSAGTCFTGGTGGGGFMMLHAGSTLATDSDEFMDAIANGGAGGNPPISNGGNYGSMGGSGNPGALHRGTANNPLNGFGVGGSGNVSPIEPTYYGFGEDVNKEDRRSSSGVSHYLGRPYSPMDNTFNGTAGTLIILVNGAYSGNGFAISQGQGLANIHDGFGGGAGGAGGGGVVVVLDDNGSGGTTSKVNGGPGTNAYSGGAGGAGSAIRGTYSG